MNEHTILSEIDRLRDATPNEKRLLREEQFLASLWRVVHKISKNNIQMFSNQVNILLNSLLRRYRRMVQLQAREAQSNEKLFLQLLKQKMKDNFQTLDRNLRKFQLRGDLRRPNSIFNKMSLKINLKKFSNLWSNIVPRSALSQEHLVFWKTGNLIKKSSASLMKS